MTKKTVDPTGLQIVEEWGYDGAGNVTSRVDELGNTWSFEYNWNNDLIRMTDPEGYETTYTLNAVGHLLAVERDITSGPGSDTYNIDFLRDAYGRVLERTVAPGTPDEQKIDIYYASSGCGCGGATYGTSLPSKVVDGQGKITHFDYDEVDRLETLTRQVGPNRDADDAVVSFFYDDNGNTTQVIGPEGETTARVTKSRNSPKKRSASGRAIGCYRLGCRFYAEESRMHSLDDAFFSTDLAPSTLFS
jgi:YD repeat-containing protein